MSGESETIVLIERRRDGRLYFFDRSGNCNPRRSSSMRLPETDAKILAAAISSQHPDFTAKAIRYDDPIGRKKEKRNCDENK